MATAWQLGPVLRAMRGHRAAAALVVIQLAIGLAITVLAVLIGDYVLRREEPLGATERDVSVVELQVAGRAQDAVDRRTAALAAVRSSPHAACAVLVGLPLYTVEHAPDDVRLAPDQAASRVDQGVHVDLVPQTQPASRVDQGVHVDLVPQIKTASRVDQGVHVDLVPQTKAALRVDDVEAGPDFTRVTGITLRAGRDITASDVGARETAALISSSVARELWPGRDPVGQTLLSRAHGTVRVIGVIDEVRSALYGTEDPMVIYAREPSPASPRTVILVRSRPGEAAELRADLTARLRQPGQAAIVRSALEHARLNTTPVGTVVAILGTMVGAIVLVILIGSMGLTYFLVARRTHEIGLRRALGATKGNVVRYFLVENLIFTLAGSAIGFAIVMLVLPTVSYEQDAFYVRWGLIALSIAAVAMLNVVATLIPALKAAGVPPVVASRTA